MKIIIIAVIKVRLKDKIIVKIKSNYLNNDYIMRFKLMETMELANLQIFFVQLMI